MAGLTVQRWSVRHAGGLEKIYHFCSQLMIKLYPLVNRLGFARLERPVAFVEKHIKGFLFDCQMCGQCELSRTGMSCSMRCPKNIRNGPCGGVRANGHCEVNADMPCVWVDAWTGSQLMADKKAIDHVLPAVDRGYKNSSAWLRWMRQQNGRSEVFKK